MIRSPSRCPAPVRLLLATCLVAAPAAHAATIAEYARQAEQARATCGMRAKAIDEAWAARRIDRFARDRLALAEQERCDRGLAAIDGAAAESLRLQREREARRRSAGR